MDLVLFTTYFYLDVTEYLYLDVTQTNVVWGMDFTLKYSFLDLLP